MRGKYVDFEKDLNNKSVAGIGYRGKEFPRLSKQQRACIDRLKVHYFAGSKTNTEVFEQENSMTDLCFVRVSLAAIWRMEKQQMERLLEESH